jgi:hypothetical protein
MTDFLTGIGKTTRLIEWVHELHGTEGRSATWIDPKGEGFEKEINNG